jgi:hypothetical protein
VRLFSVAQVLNLCRLLIVARVFNLCRLGAVPNGPHLFFLEGVYFD